MTLNLIGSLSGSTRGDAFLFKGRRRDAPKHYCRLDRLQRLGGWQKENPEQIISSPRLHRSYRVQELNRRLEERLPFQVQ